MKLNCIVIDDEHLAREYLKDYISKLPFLNFIGDFNSPLKALDLIKSGNVDLLFLDIQMPDITGLEFLRTMSQPPMTIITTAYKEFAVEGYELNVVDYLLKPFSLERFMNATNKALSIFESASNSPHTSPATPTELKDDYLVIRADRKHYKINYEDLLFIEGQKAYVTFHTTTKPITALFSLKELEEKLPSKRFMRIHKSYIVSVKHICALEGNLIEIAGKQIPVGKNYRKEVASIFGIDD